MLNVYAIVCVGLKSAITKGDIRLSALPTFFKKVAKILDYKLTTP